MSLCQICAVSEYFTLWLLCCFLFLPSFTKHIQLFFLKLMLLSNLPEKLCVCVCVYGFYLTGPLSSANTDSDLILAGPAVVIRDLESQEAEEGAYVILHCELSKPGLHVEWKKETLVLICGEKYQTKQTGLTYDLQIFDLLPEDSGSYSCCSEDTISSAFLVVNGRTEVFFSPHAISSQSNLLDHFFPTFLHRTVSSSVLILR